MTSFAQRRRSATTGAGTTRAVFGFGFRGGHSITHSIARGVTDPGVALYRLVRPFFFRARGQRFHRGFDLARSSLVFRRRSTATLFEFLFGELSSAERRRSATTGAGAPRATFELGFRFWHFVFHFIARGVTDPGVGCTDWFGLYFHGKKRGD